VRSRSIFGPEKDSCFFLYEGASADAVGEAGRRAALAFAGVTSTVPIVNLHDDRSVSAHGRGMEPRQTLTPKEERVARLVAQGRSTPEVARMLDLSPKTVETHLFRVYRKLGIHSRGELAGHLRETEPMGAPLGRAGSKDEPDSPFSGGDPPVMTVEAVDGRGGESGDESGERGV
jgi:DNA-binding CsgD family transcriptional regulator